MKLVIDISEATYKRWKDDIYNPQYDAMDALKAIRNGTPLPKGHGRLIDADEIRFENADFDTYGDYSIAFDAIDYAPTIIEADKTESEDKE